MTTKNDVRAFLASDDARMQLCECMGDALRAGVVNFRFSFIRQTELIRDLSIHAFQHHIWMRLDIRTSDDVTNRLWLRLSTVADRETTAIWDCRRVEHPGQTDFELSFHPRVVARGLSGDVESFLNRCFF